MKFKYPSNVFPTVWDNLSNLVDDGRLISPKAVYNELKAKSDELYDWAKNHKKMFKTVDDYSVVKNVIKECPWLIDSKKESAIQADPYVIALVILESTKHKRTMDHYTNPNTHFIVAEDKGLSEAANKHNINPFKILKFFEEENWSF